jgi:hypothetical protein
MVSCSPQKNEAEIDAESNTEIAAETPPETEIVSEEIAFSEDQEIKEMYPKLGRVFKDDEIEEYSKLINASIKAFKITASSYLQSNSKTLTYGPENIHDLDFQNAWVQGVEGVGIGEYIVFHFGKYIPDIKKIVFANGYVKSDKTYRENSRPKRIKMYVNDNPYAVLNLQDIRREQIFIFEPIDISECTLKFEILEVYKGDKYEDTSISEIYFSELPDLAFDGVIVGVIERNNETRNLIINDLRIAGSGNASTGAYFAFQGAYSDFSFLIKLPNVVNAPFLVNVETTVEPWFEVSDKSANLFEFSQIEAYDSNGSYVGTFRMFDSTIKKVDHGDYTLWEGSDYYISFCYVDRDVTIEGYAKPGGSFSKNPKKGWNKVYNEYYAEVGCNVTTTPFDHDVNWRFEKPER